MKVFRRESGWVVTALAGILLLGAGCAGSAAEHCAGFDQLLLPPAAGKPAGSLRYRADEEVADYLLALGFPETPREIEACSLRLMLVCNRDAWAFNRLMALQALGNIATRIGPGPAPEFPGSRTRITPPDLGTAFRTRLAAEEKPAGWSTLRQALRQVFIRALFDSSLEVRNGGVELLYQLWGARGLRCVFIYLSSRDRQEENRELLRLAIALCGEISPVEARDSTGNAPSIFFLLHQFTQFAPFAAPILEALEMIAKHSICRIMQVEPRYDREWFDKWWQEEQAAKKKEKAG